MNKKDISQKTLTAIKNKGIKPKSKWSFVLRDLLLIVVGGLSLLIATMSFGMMVYHFLDSDIGLYAQKGPKLGWFVLSTFPYIWIVILILFAVLAYIYLKNFKPFYRFRLPITIVGFFVVCIVFGWMTLASGFAKVTDDAFDRHMPIYSRLMDRGAGFWMDPDAGVLGGLVNEVDDAEHFIVVDPAGYIWKVEATGCDPNRCQEPLAGYMVKMSGQRSEGDIFIAEMVRTRPASIHCLDKDGERNYCPMRINR